MLLGGHEGGFSRDPLPVFSTGGRCEQFWHEQECPLCDFAQPAFPLQITASPTRQGALKDSFGEAVVACDISRTMQVSVSRQLLHWPINRAMVISRSTECQVDQLHGSEVACVSTLQTVGKFRDNEFGGKLAVTAGRFENEAAQFRNWRSF